MEDAPDDHIHEIFSNTLWPDHPIGLPILGCRESVRSFGHAESMAFRAPLRVRQLRCSCSRQRRPRRARRPGRDSPDSRTGPGPCARLHTRPPLGSCRAQEDGAGAHLLRRLDHERSPPGPVRVVARRRGARRRDGITAVPGDSREARLAYAVYSYSMLYQDTGEFAVYAGTSPSTPRRSSASFATRSSVLRSTASCRRSWTACGRPRTDIWSSASSRPVTA